MVDAFTTDDEGTDVAALDFTAPPSPRSHSGALAQSGQNAQPRSPAELAERALAAFDGLEIRGPEPATVVGTSEGSAVRLSMSHGRITACEIEPRWLERQDEITLNRALRDALTEANAARIEADRPSTEFAHRLTEVLADAKATLAEITEVSGAKNLHFG
jgi:hypothetical protein